MTAAVCGPMSAAQLRSRCRIPALRDSQVLRRHVRVDRGVVATASAFAVGGDALAAMEDLDGVGRVAHVDLFARVAVRHRVIVLIEFDVIVRPDARDLPISVLIGLLGQAA